MTQEQITELGLDCSAARLMPPGTISMALYGATIGKLGILTFEAATNQACANVIPNTRLVESKYLYYYLLSERQKFIELGQGGAQPNISQEIVRKHPFQLAPLPEQKRIVAKLEALLERVEGCQRRMAKIPQLLKRFRQAILAAACSGRLTADWREENAILKDDDASDLPNAWQPATVGAVIENLKYGTSQKCSHEKVGVPVLRIPNIADGIISHSDLKYAKLPEKEFQQLRLQKGDILLIRSNGSVSLVGKCALAREADQDFAYAGYLIRLRPNSKKVLPEFLNLVLGSYGVRSQIEIPARSTSGVNNINSEEVRALEFFLPLLPEQQEIVRRVEGLFALADKLEARLATAQRQVDRLTPSILARAFAGRLVPQNPADEPAERLLERLKAKAKG
jgi:type I restriction enzyme S subunit